MLGSIGDCSWHEGVETGKGWRQWCLEFWPEAFVFGNLLQGKADGPSSLCAREKTSPPSGRRVFRLVVERNTRWNVFVAG